MLYYRELVSLELSNLSIENQPYAVLAIKTEHSLGNKTMIHATDIREEIPMVIINVSSEDVHGRVSIPLKYTAEDFQAKHVGDAFNDQFHGRCVHDGTRYDNSVCDFRLTAKLVDDESLKNIFKKVEQLIEKYLNK